MVQIKQEPGVFVKSEHEPSWASLPMAPPAAVKNEVGDGNKPARANAPEHRGKDRRFRRGRGGSSIVHLVDGYHIRAHYGRGKVDFTITKNTEKTRELNWREIERTMLEKLHRIGFRIEPTQRPGSVLQTFSSDSFKSGSILRLSVFTNNIAPRAVTPATSYAGSSLAGLHGGVGSGVKNEDTKITPSSQADRRSQHRLEVPLPALPDQLPDIFSYQIDDHNGKRHHGTGNMFKNLFSVFC